MTATQDMSNVVQCFTSIMNKLPSQVILAIDTSTTETTDAILLEHLRACHLIVDMAPSGVYFSIVVFGTTPFVVTDFKNDKVQIKQELGVDITKLKTFAVGTEPVISNVLTFCRNSIIKPKLSPQQGSPIVVLFSSALPPVTDTAILNTVASLRDQHISLMAVSNNPAIDIQSLSGALGNTKTLSRAEIPDIPRILFTEYNEEREFAVGVCLDPTAVAQTLNDAVLVNFLLMPLKSDLPANYRIEVQNSRFYQPWTQVLSQPMKHHQKVVIPCTLAKSFDATLNPPPRIFFNILDPSGRVVTSGYFSIPTALFAGEFYEPFSVVVDGVVGSGKSSLNNGLLNVFTCGNVSYPFFTSKSTDSHGTEFFHFYPICVYVNKYAIFKTALAIDIIKKLKLVLIDKKGITATDNRVGYLDIFEGRYRPNDIKRYSEQDARYSAQVCIYVATARSFLDASVLGIIQSKLRELVSIKAQPILAVTTCDTLTAAEVERIKAIILSMGIVSEHNIMYMSNYIDENPERDIDRDYNNLALLLRAKSVAKNGNSSVEDDANDYFANL
ncbi:hypothetical protein DFA_00607 [Cavenderia fasciculata]|uniref:VWFA domain-containing protein n=1 Tax=Cavenderia fasciculata TaxID=261658 RepID=F4PSV5_CACFS|nr:uncharacterized protein DFA_00607 [Cavenderia fasciculata]EGG20744.1 hypothetical protein DFA_00607 [Cavenderia fasciculata]|eukprot:XP_004358594.1 hypothetical protein DFA_00607 [Cavenderia fasciculata]